MAVNTVLLDFSVDPKEVKNELQLSLIAANLENILRDYLTNLKLINTFSLEGGIFKLYSSDLGSITNVRIFSNGLITVNIEYYKGDKQEPLLTFELTKQIEQKIYITLSCFRSKLFPLIKRGGSVDVYLTSSGAIVLIAWCLRNGPHSKRYFEADLIYTETLMARGKENYKDKEIVILGGGDGALLYELLKEEPKNVIMLEIDEVVMGACAKYRRSICGEVLDKRSGSTYHEIYENKEDAHTELTVVWNLSMAS